MNEHIMQMMRKGGVLKFKQWYDFHDNLPEYLCKYDEEQIQITKGEK